MTQPHTSNDRVAALKCELAGEVLRSFGSLRFTATGWSMLPAIFPGDTLVVKRVAAGGVRVGDVALVGRDGALCAHRVVAMSDDLDNPAWITQGDALSEPDRSVTSHELLGRVTFIEREGGLLAIGAPNLCTRWVRLLVRRSHVAARIVVGMHSCLSLQRKSGPYHALRKLTTRGSTV